jgi:phage tail-like protein
VSLCDERGDPVVTWRVQKALPTRLEAPGLQASSNEAAVESLTLMAAGISIETH